MAKKRRSRKSKKVFILSILVVLFLAGLIFLLFESRNQSFLYEDLGVDRPRDYPVLGVDISHHQGKIDFNKLVDSGKDGDSIQFVYIKATEGTDHIDSRYEKNAEALSEYEIPYGFYHYFHPSISATLQADFFITTIKFYNFKLRPVIDVEVDQDQNAQAIRDSVKVFIDEVEKELDVEPLLYSYVSFYDQYLNSATLEDQDLWLAAYSQEVNSLIYPRLLLWQFTEKGTVDGVKTYIDLNVGREGVLDSLAR